MLGWEAVTQVRWDHLFHAYGLATDTPAQLAALTAEAGAADPLGHLHGAVLHQGTIYSATAPAARVVAGLLSSIDDAEVRANLLGWLADVADSLEWFEAEEEIPQHTGAEWAEFHRQLNEDDDSVWASPLAGVAMMQAAAELRAMAPEVLAAVLACQDDQRPVVQQQVLHAASKWGALLGESTAHEAALQAGRDGLARATSRDERAVAALALGQLGADLGWLLDDPDEAVRACAALFVPTPAATAILIEALTQPAAIDDWFTEKPSYFEMRARFRLLDELLSRQVPLEELLPAAISLIGHATAHSADFEWGPLLEHAFPDAGFSPGVRPPLPDTPTPAQLEVLHAVARNDRLWERWSGNASLARMKVGIPELQADLVCYLVRHS